MATLTDVSLSSTLAKTQLSLADVMCPICLSILVEPVTLPCSHSLCRPCFNQHLAKTSLECPICRRRKDCSSTSRECSWGDPSRIRSSFGSAASGGSSRKIPGRISI
ncbi:hypothetical protein OTU49_009115 [Cherax quadricarinatus]|uniref:RING-type E3 ubiquitin transferase n=1 Tax=Cherax quadricarinatus TaxID=27406 RepID=A0AAW0WB74_CHEQU